MKVKVFQANHNGKIEFTRVELEKLLNDVYIEAYHDGEAAQREKSNFTWTAPYLTSTYDAIAGTDNKISGVNVTTATTATNIGTNGTNVTTNIENNIEKNTISPTKLPTPVKANKEKAEPYTLTAPFTPSEAEVAAKYIDDIIKAFVNPNLNSNSSTNDVYSKLAKELNF